MANFVTGIGREASHGHPVIEREAIAAAAKGDHRAFAWLVEQYKHMVYTISYRTLRNAQEAEEATQDSFVKAYRDLGRFQGRSKFSTWLYTIAYRNAISQLRKRRVNEMPLEGLGPAEPKVHPVQDAGASDRHSVLTKALAELAPEDAALITSYYLEEMRVEEIVTMTGMGASNVKVRLHRSRKRLLELLQNELKEELWTLIED